MEMTQLYGVTDLGVLDEVKKRNYGLTLFSGNLETLQMIWQTRQMNDVGLYIGRKNADNTIYLSKVEENEAFEMLFFNKVRCDYFYTGKK